MAAASHSLCDGKVHFGRGEYRHAAVGFRIYVECFCERVGYSHEKNGGKVVYVPEEKSVWVKARGQGKQRCCPGKIWKLQSLENRKWVASRCDVKLCVPRELHSSQARFVMFQA